MKALAIIAAVIGFVQVAPLLGFEMPDSREMARVSAFILLIMVVVAAITTLGWGGPRARR